MILLLGRNLAPSGKTKECKILDQLHTLTGSSNFWTTVPPSQSFLTPFHLHSPGPPNDTTRSHLRSWSCTTGTHSFNVFFNPKDLNSVLAPAAESYPSIPGCADLQATASEVKPQEKVWWLTLTFLELIASYSPWKKWGKQREKVTHQSNQPVHTIQ